MQAQRKIMLDLFDNGLRALSKGQQLEDGKTRQKKFKSDKTQEALVFLRGRLVGLNWSWSDGFIGGNDDNEGEDEIEDGNDEGDGNIEMEED